MQPTIHDVLTISVDDSGPTPIVRLSGDVDFGTGPDLRARLTEILEAGIDVVVDLRDVQFMDPAGLAALLGARKEAARRGATLSLRSPPRPVARTLATSGAERIVTIEW